MKTATKFVIVLLGLVLLMDFGASDDGVFRTLVKRNAQMNEQGSTPSPGGQGGRGGPGGQRGHGGPGMGRGQGGSFSGSGNGN